MLLDHLGKPMPKPTEKARAASRGILSASVDAGLNIPELSGHFRHADTLGPNTSLTKDVRQRIRSKARMERSQNSYLTGILQTLSNFVIGTGPKLQMQITGEDGTPDRELNTDIEQEFGRWAKHVGLAEKLRTAVATRKLDGEAFLSIVKNPRARKHTGYGLSLQLFEADQVQVESIYHNGGTNDGGDGVVYDKYGNALKYPVLRQHPGETNAFDGTGSIVQWIPEDYMCHLYRVDRPGQKRGVSEILAALPLFAMLRRMTLATVTNMEKAANITGVLESDAEVDEFGNSLSNVMEEDWLSELPTGRNTLLTLPGGMKVKEFQGANPNTEYSLFQKSIIREIARCLCIPYNVAAGDSSDMNYSSGRLDHQTFAAANAVERSYIEANCLDLILGQWLKLYYASEFGLDPDTVDTYNLGHTWMWVGLDDVDQAKATLAADRELRFGGTSRGALLAAKGIDIDTHDERAATELGYDSVQEYRRSIAAYLHGEPKAEESVTEAKPNRKPENDLND